MRRNAALVVLSGGQDSTTCLFVAKANHEKVYAITFDYHQRHDIEIRSACRVAAIAGVESHEIIQLGPILQGTSPLVNKESDLSFYRTFASMPGGVEATFVPTRNALFLTIAANRAAVLNLDHIYTGVCEADSAGYYDCRKSFIVAIEKALNIAVYGELDRLIIHTPLIDKTKEQSVKIAKELPGCWEALAHTHTCYHGTAIPCGLCHACLIRARGFHRANLPDPLIARLKQEEKISTTVPDSGLLVEDK